MDRVLDTAVGVLREIIAHCDEFETRLSTVGDYLIAEKLGEMTLREDVAGRFRAEYYFWVQRLADFLGVTVNPYSSIGRAMGGGGMSRQRIAPC